MDDARAEGARGITYEIEKNRGLTPHRYAPTHVFIYIFSTYFLRLW